MSAVCGDSDRSSAFVLKAVIMQTWYGFVHNLVRPDWRVVVLLMFPDMCFYLAIRVCLPPNLQCDDYIIKLVGEGFIKSDADSLGKCPGSMYDTGEYKIFALVCHSSPTAFAADLVPLTK